MTTWKEERLQKSKLRRAVLDALTERVDRSPAPPRVARVDTRHLPDSAGYKLMQIAPWDAVEDSYWAQVGLSDEDDDWRDVRACGDNPSLPPDRFVHFYDPEEGTTYYVESEPPRGTNLGATIPTDDDSALANISSGEEKSPVFEGPEVDKILTRMELMDGQFGPRGYFAWLSKRIQNRYHTESDIPGFAALCNQCHSILTHSLFVFGHQFRAGPGCTGLRYQTHHKEEIFSHHRTLVALRASARTGCHFCSLLLGPYIWAEDPFLSDEGYCTTYSLQISDWGEIHIRVCMTVSSVHYLSTILKWDEERTSKPSTLNCNHTNAPAIRNLARSWLFRCLQEDQKDCAILTEFLPSRLIRIDTKNETVHSARLVLRDDLPPDTQYLTLSHCWGGIKMASLTEETFVDFQTDIPMSVLSKTSRETLQVVAWLGYHYVWIDSLCILQDSVSDWGKEAAVMGDIYRHSTLTIAATGANNGNEGLFFKRSAVAFTDCPMFERIGERFYARSDGTWPTPLSDRAWAVQERCLSSRTLNFGIDKVSWACRRTEACEGPHAHDLYMEIHSFPKLLDCNTDEHMVNESWHTIVRQYSGCKLTFWKDKWPAFQGLTTEVEKAQNWKIVHGLRRHLLAQDLLWRAPNSEIGLETINHDQPSWSWLNVEGSILMSEITFPMVLDAKVDLRERPVPTNAQDATGAISQDVIQIEACMVEFMTNPLKGSPLAQHCTLAVTNPTYQSTFAPSVPESGQLLPGFWYPDTIPFHNGNLWAVQIFSEWSQSQCFRYWNHEMEGLVVTAAPDKPGFWRRLGTYRANSLYLLPKEGPSSEASTLSVEGKSVPILIELDLDQQISVNFVGVPLFTHERFSEEEAALLGLPCPWNREKSTILLI